MPSLYYTRNEKHWHTTNSTASAPTNATHLVASELYPEESLGLRVVELVVPPEIAGNRAETIVVWPSRTKTNACKEQPEG